ncbi:MAG: hypothetical protein KKB50_17935 [Planctomycetes bacterium]|nr:hypothetical protein [Planctomycetota bacterium]
MRTRLLVITALTWLLVGGTCLPLYDGTIETPQPSTELALSLHAPSVDRTVPQGTLVNVEWSGANYTGSPATVTILVESRPGFVETAIAENLTVSGVQPKATLQWDTTSFEATQYALIGRIVAGAKTANASATGKITIDGPPSFEFTAPSADTTLEAGGTVTIRWRGSDVNGGATVRIGLDPDTDHGSANEVFIHEADLPTSTESDSIDWAGADTAGGVVEAGTYYVFALVDDAVNPTQMVDGLARITVAEEEEEEDPVTLSIITPEADVEFLSAADPLAFEFGVNEAEDVLIDIKIDTDDNHANGNEQVILSQRLVTAGTETDTFDWDGTDASGAALADGIYAPFLVLSRGSGQPETANGGILIYRRTSANSAPSRQTWENGGTSWTLVEPETSPSARSGHALAFDSARNVTVLFGGTDSEGSSAQTWEWDRTDWTEHEVAGPDALVDHALAFDAQREVTLLFGGSRGGVAQSETWTWDGTTWTRLDVAGPSARHSHAMAYDSERNVVVLFGGTDGVTRNAETWEWDGTTWTQATTPTAPSAREAHALAYDADRQVTMLFGGLDADGVNGETWTWDGSEWTSNNLEESPSARHGHALAYNASRRVVVLFGGAAGGLANAETWHWNGTTWTQQEFDTNFAARVDHSMVYDSDGQRVVLFGGESGQPLIALQTPAAIRTVSPGDYISIQWRDDDPTGLATVRLTVDDDRTPAEATETDGAEIEILANREAAKDGVLDSYSWQVPSTLTPGTYYFFAYIDRNGAAPYDHNSVAPAIIVVEDPTQP